MIMLKPEKFHTNYIQAFFKS